MNSDYSNLSVKELRQELNISRNDIEKDLEIPVRTIQNWENGYRKCPEYTEKLIRKYLIQQSKVAKIQFENAFGTDKLKGYSCYFLDLKSKNFDIFSWFYPIKDNAISQEIIHEIAKLNNNDYKIIFA